MKYYLIVFAVILSGSVYAQERTFPGNNMEFRQRPAMSDNQILPDGQRPAGPGMERMPREDGVDTGIIRRGEVSQSDRLINPPMMPPRDGQPVDAEGVKNRVRNLTDIKADPAQIISDRFNFIQQRRLEKAGMIDEKREEKRETLMQKFEEKKVEWQEKRTQLAEKRHDRVENIAENALGKLQEAVDRLSNTDEKLQSYITEESDQVVIDSLEEANLLLEQAKSSLEVVKSEIDTELNNEDGLSQDALRELINQAKEDTKAAWDAYKEVINLIKNK